MPSINELKTIALNLKATRALEVAVAERQTVHGPTGEVVFACYPAGGRAPYTPASLLLQAIGNRSHRISDIVTTQADRVEMGTGMYQMVYSESGSHVVHADSAATPAPDVRLTELDTQAVIDRRSLDEFEIPAMKLASVTGGISGDNTSNIHRIYMLAAYALLQKQKTGQVGDGLQVAAVMVNRQGAIVACGINTNKVNCTYHAEVNLLQSMFKRTKDNLMPQGARIYTTLQPCQMCAGMIYNCRNTNNAANPLVFYGQIDPGQLRKTTALSNAHLERLLSHNQDVSHLDANNRARAVVAGGPKAVKLFYKDNNEIISDFSQNLEERERQFEGTAAKFGERININAVLFTLQRKYLRNTSPRAYSPINEKTVNPAVLRTVEHVVDFLKKMNITLPTIDRSAVRGDKWA